MKKDFKKPEFKLLKEFKAFITKGNVVDLAVGMIIGAAFTAIVTALVNNIFKPLINAIPISSRFCSSSSVAFVFAISASISVTLHLPRIHLQ